jgi:hypothetical protein
VRSICVASVLVSALVLSACFGGGDDTPPPTSATPHCTPATESSGALPIAPRWSAGDTRSITISKTHEESGQTPEETSATADLRVLDAGPSGARMRWKSTDIVLPDDQLSSAAKERLKEVAQSFEIVYRTRPSGAYERKLNVGAVRDQLKKVLGVLQEDPAQAASIARTRSIILSDDFIQTSVVKEIAVLHNVYGLKLAEAKPQPVTRLIPNPFGGAALTARGTAELIERRDDGGCAVVEVDVKPDRTALATSISRTFGAKSSKVPAAAKRAGLSVRDSSRYLYDAGSGWIVRVDFTQTVTIRGKSRSDITVITTR